jgi:hypothetical protein
MTTAYCGTTAQFSGHFQINPQPGQGYTALVKQLSDEGTGGFHRGRTARPKLRESGLCEERSTNRKASASASRAVRLYPRAC